MSIDKTIGFADPNPSSTRHDGWLPVDRAQWLLVAARLGLPYLVVAAALLVA